MDSHSRHHKYDILYSTYIALQTEALVELTYEIDVQDCSRGWSVIRRSNSKIISRIYRSIEGDKVFYLLLRILLHDFIQLHALDKRLRLDILTGRVLHSGQQILELQTDIFVVWYHGCHVLIYPFSKLGNLKPNLDQRIQIASRSKIL